MTDQLEAMICDSSSIYAVDDQTNEVSHDGKSMWPLGANTFMSPACSGYSALSPSHQTC